MSLSHAVKTSHRLRSTKATTTMSSGSLQLCSHARTLKIRLNLNSHSSLSRLGNSSPTHSSRSNHSRGGTSRTGDSNRTLSNHSSHRTGISNRTHSSKTGATLSNHSSKTGATLSNHSRDTTTLLNSSSKSCRIRFLKRLLPHGRFCREAYFEAV